MGLNYRLFYMYFCLVSEVNHAKMNINYLIEASVQLFKYMTLNIYKFYMLILLLKG